MTGEVQYAYPATSTVIERYGEFNFTYNATPNVYVGRINLLPAGYWKYQVFEVIWQTKQTGGELPYFSNNMPPTEDFVFNPAANDLGVVQGEVTKGKMYIEEKVGTEEVTYTQKSKSFQSLYGIGCFESEPQTCSTPAELCGWTTNICRANRWWKCKSDTSRCCFGLEPELVGSGQSRRSRPTPITENFGAVNWLRLNLE